MVKTVFFKYSTNMGMLIMGREQVVLSFIEENVLAVPLFSDSIIFPEMQRHKNKQRMTGSRVKK